MIISHKYKFIFVKTLKTAGTSIEISLSRYCGDSDIITPISPTDEKIRAEFGKYPQNYKVDHTSFFNHIPANQIKSIIGEDIWNSYYKFSFDRNPWDKVISAYYYFVNFGRNPKETSFDKFLEQDEGYKYAYNFPIYTIDNNSVVDYLGKYESLESDLKSICDKIAIPFDGWLPKAKGDFRKNRQHYRTLYNKHQKEIIENYFKKEIELLDYKF